MDKSFSTEVKYELCELNIQSPDEATSELAAILLFGENEENGDIVIKTQHAQIAARIQALLKKAIREEISIDISDKKKMYSMCVSTDIAKTLGVFFSSVGEISLDEDIYSDENKKRAFLRGAFIISGTIASPEKAYSCEIFTYNEYIALLTAEILEDFDLHVNTVKRKNYHVAYLKDSSSISDFLSVIGAHKNMMEYLNAYIQKTLSNKINRQNNCHIANLGKTVDASVKQRNAINKLMNLPVWEEIDEETKCIAKIRLENPEESLEKIGKMVVPVMSKSAVSRRLNKLIEKAEEL